jgi:cardiolipin synthase A/B
VLGTLVYQLAALAGALFGLASAMHALLYKRDPRSQLGWLLLCLLVPIAGAIAYWTIGVNRIRTRARRWQERGLFDIHVDDQSFEQASAVLSAQHPKRAATMEALLSISRRVTQRPLLRESRVEPLYNGEQAYPAMIEAIREARESVYLCTYIFDTDQAGREFVDALAAAHERGVDVRVLVDAIGERYSYPRVTRLLRKRGVRAARFLPMAPTLRGLRFNLRNHRKVMIVDREIGFTGGMNLGQRHMVDDPKNKRATADIHFRVRGPAVYSLEEVFLEDWQFATGDAIDWPGIREVVPAGEALCRGIKDGPNEDFEKLTWILVGALSSARSSVKIMTPYFIPSREIVAGLNAAVLRGIDVELILPARSNLPFVDWATRSMLWEVMQYGVKVHLQPAPFCHSKLLVVDDFYVQIGSANIDPRSLRLNFEFNLEVYDNDLGRELSSHFDEVRSRSHPLDGDELDARSLPVKLRDAIAKLFSPYL